MRDGVKLSGWADKKGLDKKWQSMENPSARRFCLPLELRRSSPSAAPGIVCEETGGGKRSNRSQHGTRSRSDPLSSMRVGAIPYSHGQLPSLSAIAAPYGDVRHSDAVSYGFAGGRPPTV